MPTSSQMQHVGLEVKKTHMKEMGEGRKCLGRETEGIRRGAQRLEEETQKQVF